MTIKKMYEWAVSRGFENYPVQIFKDGQYAVDITRVELVKKDSLFNGIFYNVDTETLILE